MSSSRSVRWLSASVVAAAVLGGAVWYARREKPPVVAPSIQARLELAAGPVLVDAGQGPARAVSGAALLAGALVKTEGGARALVRLPDGSSLFFRDGTSARLGAEAVTLEAGEVWLDAPPSDRKGLVHRLGAIELGAADAGASVKRTADGAVVYVARGMVTVTAPGGRVEVKAGEQVVVKGNEPPSVAPVSFWDDWTGGMADLGGGFAPGAGAGSIYGVDAGARPGTPARRLEVQRQAVRAVLREGLAETEVDQTFFNPGERPVEGWYWFTVPPRASVVGFAVETDGQLIEGEFIEQKEASAKYTAAKQSGHSPAILEWVDERTFRARIHPVPAGGVRRAVLRYVELLSAADGKLAWVYPMSAGGHAARIGEFSLSADLGAGGQKMSLATLADARVEDGGRRVTMRRSGFTPRSDFHLEARLPEARPTLTVARQKGGGESADYVLARYTPAVDWKSIPEPRGDVVVVVDTSAAGDEGSRQLKVQTAEAILRALSDSDQFVLVALDVKPTVMHPAEGMAKASEAEIARALEALAGHPAGGATDLGSIFDVALRRVHGTEQPAIVYVGDGVATTGEMSGAQLVERLRRAMGTSRARLFTVAAGPESDHALLGELARAGGGATFRVDEAEQATARALDLAAAVKVPTITDLELDLGAGLDEVFQTAAGKLSRGEELLVLARTHHDLPAQVVVKGRVGGKDFRAELPIKEEKGPLAAFVPRLWAAENIRRLLGSAEGAEAERGRVVALGLEYGLMTPFTSVLALESEAAYGRMGIQRRRSPLRGVRLGALSLPTAGGVDLLFGCGRSSDAPRTLAEQRGESSDNKEGGYGTRAKGEEGSMGRPAAAPAAAAPGPPPVEAELQAKAAEAAPRGNMWGDEIGDATGAGGLGLTGIGEGGGGKDDGVGLGAIGTLGHGAGTGTGQGFGSGHGRLGGAHAAKAAVDPARRAEPPLAGGARMAAAPVPTATSSALDRAQALRDARAAALLRPLATCSDSAERPLAQRALLWQKRLRTATSPSELLERYRTAIAACELPDWRSERTFLDLLQRRINDAGGVHAVLGHLAGRPDVQRFVARQLLRRAVDPVVVAAVERALFAGAVDWVAADNQLAEIADPEKRLAKLRELTARHPDDPNGAVRLARLLVDLGRKDEALALGRRLRDAGLITPTIAREIGDVLARAGLPEEAVRTYSEIVEFDAGNPASRRLLGDIYLGHGWYEPAYRQYLTLTETAPADPLGWLRLAAAAAGTGRVDEALRLERKVAGAQGTPGPDDPRRWARWLSAARLARLLAEPPAPAAGEAPPDPARRAESVQRELKELQLFSGPGTLVIVVWEQLDAQVVAATRVEGKDAPVGEALHAPAVGLDGVLMAPGEAAITSFVARLDSPRREVPLTLVRHDLTWDGKRFQVAMKRGTLAAREVAVDL